MDSARICSKTELAEAAKSLEYKFPNMGQKGDLSALIEQLPQNAFDKNGVAQLFVDEQDKPVLIFYREIPHRYVSPFVRFTMRGYNGADVSLNLVTWAPEVKWSDMGKDRYFASEDYRETMDSIFQAYLTD